LVLKSHQLEKYEKLKMNLFATVKFVAEVISVKKDKENKIIEGILIKLNLLLIAWKFTRNIKKKILIGICLKLSVSDKKKNLNQEDKKLGKIILKIPQIFTIKIKNQKNFRKERYKFDLHGFTLDEANKKVKEIIESCVKKKFKEILLITGKGFIQH
jgi:hypothetical protein